MPKLLILLLFFSSACSTLPHEAESIQKLIGKKGFFSRPIAIKLPEDNPEKYASSDVYKACSPVKIINIETIETEDKWHYFGVHFQQGKRLFYTEKIDESPIAALKVSELRVRNLEKNFRPRLPFKQRKVFMEKIKKDISSKKLMCNGVIWTKMTKKEFLFVKGRPSKINIPSSARENREEWLYAFSEDPAENKIYIFKNGLLESWKAINPDNTGTTE
jgi:hypothetical protein